MFILGNFEAELKKDNSHFERFIKSSLHNLVVMLRRPMPKPTAFTIAKEMNKISGAKWKKYANTHRYLLRVFPELSRQLSGNDSGLGESVPGYQPGKWNRTKDKDGHWHEYILQQRGNSCGPACVTMIKTIFHPIAKMQLREPQVRGNIALFEQNKQHTGVSSVSTEAISMHNWKDVGSNRGPLISELRTQPFPVPSARPVSNLAPAKMLVELRKCSSKNPAIVGWLWNGGGGHWTVCVGPTKDKSELIILDPWDGVQYVSNNDPGFMSYQNGDGTMDLSDPTFTHA
jgi:hypothetical protein